MKDHECDCSLSCCITMYSPVPWLQWHYTFLYRTWLHASSRVKTSRLMLAPSRHPYLTPISPPSITSSRQLPTSLTSSISPSLSHLLCSSSTIASLEPPPPLPLAYLSVFGIKDVHLCAVSQSDLYIAGAEVFTTASRAVGAALFSGESN